MCISQYSLHFKIIHILFSIGNFFSSIHCYAYLLLSISLPDTQGRASVTGNGGHMVQDQEDGALGLYRDRPCWVDCRAEKLFEKQEIHLSDKLQWLFMSMQSVRMLVSVLASTGVLV